MRMFSLHYLETICATPLNTPTSSAEVKDVTVSPLHPHVWWVMIVTGSSGLRNVESSIT